jgi:hypothetical protein
MSEYECPDLLTLFGRLGDDEADPAIAVCGDARRVPDPWTCERDLRECCNDMLDELVSTMQSHESEIAAAGGRDAVFRVYMSRLIARLEQRKHQSFVVN